MLPLGFGVTFWWASLGVTLGSDPWCYRLTHHLVSHFGRWWYFFGVLLCFGVLGGGGTDRSRLPRNLRIKYKSPELGLNLNGS